MRQSTMRSSVVLPQPEGTRMQMLSNGSKARQMSLSATTWAPPYVFVRLRMQIFAIGSEIEEFEAALHFGDKPRGEGAVDHRVVGGEVHRHRRPRGDAAVCGDHARRDAPDGEDRRLRRVDDRGEAVDAEHAEIGDGESAALVIERKQFLLLCLFRESA